jgi:hypothetical protein
MLTSPRSPLIVAVLLLTRCSSPIMSSSEDQSTPLDMAVPSDLTGVQDLPSVADLTSLPDQTRLPDLTSIPDLTVLPDLKSFPDMTSLSDMTTLSDMSILPDLVPAPLLDYACVCTGTACGAGAIGGDQGDIWMRISLSQVMTAFTPNISTGWTCFIPVSVRGMGGPLGCYCNTSCGSGGIGGDPDYIDLGKTQTDVNSSYGGGMSGNQTGWLCGIYRGDWNM